MHGWPEHGCVGCSMVADQIADPTHLNAPDTGESSHSSWRGDEAMGSTWAEGGDVEVAPASRPKRPSSPS